MTNYEKIMKEMTPEEYADNTTEVIDSYETDTGYVTIHGNYIVPSDIYIESKNRQDVIDVVVKWLKRLMNK